MKLPIWISGISASGKTTMGTMLANKLRSIGYDNVVFIDGDELRERSPTKFGHSVNDRYKQHNENVKFINEEMNKGKIIIVSQLSHKKDMRDDARQKIGNFFEVILKCSSDSCAKRDYKNQYTKALFGEYTCFPGITEPYEISDHPELILDTDNNDIENAFEILLKEVQKRLNYKE